MASETDPRIAQGLKLLQSKSPESAMELYELLQKTLNERRALKEGESGEIKSKPVSSKVKEAEKRLHDKKAEGNESGIDVKRLKLSEELEERRKEKERSEQARRKQEKDMEDSEDEEREESEKDGLEKQYDESTDEETSMGVDNFAMEMGLACVICSQIGMGLDTNLIECQDCHKLYHKECHHPPITEEEVNDPRNVWYCSRCSKNIKRMVAKQSKGKPAATGKDSSTSKTSKSESSSSSSRKGSDRSSTSRESSSKAAPSGLDTLASVALKSEPRPVPGSSSRASSSSSSSKTGSGSKSSSQRAEQQGKGKGGKAEPESKGRVGGASLSRSNSSSGVIKQSVGPGDQAKEANKRLQQMKKKAKVQSQQKKGEHYK